MPKKFFQRYMPDHKKIRDHKHLQIFGKLLHDPNLFHLNRRSVSGAFALGLFNAFVPVPFQMILSAAGSIFFRVNLPISVALVWITNPVTMLPMFSFAYVVGTWILGKPEQHFHFELSLEWLTNELLTIWPSFLLGCFVLATIAAIIGYATIRILWRLHILRHIKERKLRLANRRND
jgi:uncharacterized protein (DUF2062 family)